ncbi:MAG: family 78 glycoside hydrolase catalytic domain [Clostridia bacterium]
MIQAVRLRTEYLNNPLGIDCQKPRLMWNVTGAVRQSAYQIQAKTEDYVIWDSGKVATGRMAGIEYPRPLASRQRVIWQVKLWDESDREGAWSEPAFFEMGLLEASDWRARWISGDYRVNRRRRYPVDCFRRAITVQGQLQSARLYITACGLYEACLDGVKIGNFCMAPGHTDYRKRVQYQTYDVTDRLGVGGHTITVQLADGWYRGSCGAWGLKNQYGTQTKLLAQLELRYEDGRTEMICSDESWQWSDDGPIRFADNKDGETVAAFKTPTYNRVAAVTRHSVVPSASNNVPVTEHERFHPTVSVAPNGRRLYDFGQNIAGWLEFRVQAHRGQRIRIRCGEMLDADGNLTLKNIQCTRKDFATPLQAVDYTCREGENHYKTTFAVFGFQYAEVESDVEIGAEEITAIAVYSDMAQTGFFDSSNELLNRFVQATVWSTKGNSLDIPTDCPTRERHGWTGDAQLFVNTASYLFDYDTFGRKYMDDMCDGQRKNGCFRQITPPGGIDFYMNAMDGSPGWSDAGVLIPYRLWRQYGDLRILREHYAQMRKYAWFKIKTLGKWYPTALPTGVGFRHRKDIANYGQSYGEWTEPVDVNAFQISDFVSPHPEETTAYMVYMLEHMAEIAEALGEKADLLTYRKYAERARSGYRRLVETPKYSLDTDRQAKLVRPLYMKLLDEKQTEFAQKRLIQALDHYGWRLGTGFLSTPFILYVLADLGIDYAYRLLENEEMPGWLFMTKMGANTIWESWEGIEAQGGVASLNHYSKGAVCEWLFSQMCGIQIAGENHFVIAPKPGGHFTHAHAAYDSVYGRVESGWRIDGEKHLFEVVIPANCTAEIRLPDGAVYQQHAGTMTYHDGDQKES